jgi:hypothetical protein
MGRFESRSPDDFLGLIGLPLPVRYLDILCSPHNGLQTSRIVLGISRKL